MSESTDKMVLLELDMKYQLLKEHSFVYDLMLVKKRAGGSNLDHLVESFTFHYFNDFWSFLLKIYKTELRSSIIPRIRVALLNPICTRVVMII